MLIIVKIPINGTVMNALNVSDNSLLVKVSSSINEELFD